MPAFDRTWTAFKALAVARELPIQEEDFATSWELRIFDGPVEYKAIIYKTDEAAGAVIGVNVSQNATDRTDYVANFQPTVNGKIDTSAAVSLAEVLVVLKEDVEDEQVVYATDDIQITNPGATSVSDFRPFTTTENNLISTDVVATLSVASGVTDVVQTFKNSADDSHSVFLCLENTSPPASVETFEGFADTTALRAVWAPNDATKSPNTLETTTFHDGAKAMKINVSPTGSVGDSWTRTIAAGGQDWSASSGIVFWWRQSTLALALWKIQIEDTSGNVQSSAILVSDIDIWELKSFTFADMPLVGANPVDLTLVKYVRFTVGNATGIAHAIVDTVGRNQNAAVQVSIYSVASATPTTLPSALADDYGTTVKTELNVTHGTKNYGFSFHKSGLTVNGYYAIGVKLLDDPGTWAVAVHGSGSGNVYASGTALTSTNNGTSLAVATNKDVFFGVLSHVPARISEMLVSFNSDPGNLRLTVAVIDSSQKASHCPVLTYITRQTELSVFFEFNIRNIKIPAGGTLRVFITDDPSFVLSGVSVRYKQVITARVLNG